MATSGRSGFKQDNRALTLETAWGKDACLPNTFAVTERVSEPYTITIDGFCKPNSDPTKVLGQSLSLAVAWDEGAGKRYFHGIVNEVSFGGEVDRYQQVRLQAVPKLWLLTLTQKFRCFQDQTVVDIVRTILAEHGVDTVWKVSGSSTPWRFCFQYQESDFNFISRLLEHEGIYYYFEQAAGSHKMVLCDQVDGFTTCPGQSSANYAAEVGLGAGMHGYVASWEATHDVRSGSYILRDWDYIKAQEVVDSADTQNRVCQTSHKLVEYPARVGRDEDGGPASDRGGTVRARIEEVEATNPVYQGATFVRTLFAGGQFDLSGGPSPGSYNILAVNHTGAQYPPYLFGMGSGVIYSNSVTCIKKGVTYRPPRIAKRSLVHGPQTALTTDGPDEYGRMKVRFFWDSDGPSAWLRVAQFWAGPQWGSVFLPQPGNEVLVDFIDGDPDNAIIVGGVYNGKNMPPYPLPDKYCYSTIKSYRNNEIRYDDTNGAEEIYVHAQKDMNRVVENADTVKVIKSDRTITLEQGTETIKIKMGNHIRKIDLGKSETEAMQSITLKVGANKIVIDQSGITLDGIMIKLKGQAMIDSQAPMQKMNGDATVIIKGGITMIN